MLFRRREKLLNTLVNEDGLFPVLGDVLLDFMDKKQNPFGVALISKRHFWEVSIILCDKAQTRAPVHIHTYIHTYTDTCMEAGDDFCVFVA